MKDERGRTIRKDKKMYNADGTYRYVPFGQWKKKVCDEPLGETARRALKEKDKDLEELTIDNIQIQSNKEIEQSKVNKQNFPTVSEDKAQKLKIKQLKRRGFISTEKSKGLK